MMALSLKRSVIHYFTKFAPISIKMEKNFLVSLSPLLCLFNKYHYAGLIFPLAGEGAVFVGESRGITQ